MPDRADRIRELPASRPVREAALLFGLAVALAALAWALHPPRLPLRADPTRYELELEFPLVTPAEAVALYDANGAFFVDVRPGSPARTIPGAFPIRQDTFDADLREVFDFLSPNDPLIVYGDGNLIVSEVVAKRLQERGFTDIRLLQGDLSGWAKAGGELSGEATEGDGRG